MVVNGITISDNVSYSLLKVLDEDGPAALLKRKKLLGKAVFFGSLFDDFLFMSKEEFNDKYEILPMLALTPVLNKLALLLRETYKVEDIVKIKDSEELQLEVVNIIKANKLMSNIKTTSTFVKKFNFADFYLYVEACFLDKELIFTSDLAILKECRASLYTNKRTKDYLLNDLDNIYQLEINHTYKTQNIKTILDMVIIDHKNKIIKGIDLKTGAPKAEEFSKNFFMFKYYLQAALYQKALHHLNSVNFNGTYTVEPFRFLYLCRTEIGNPLIYKVSQKWIEAGMKGFTTVSGFKYRGVDELIDELIWHKTTKLFEHPRKLYENLEIDLEDFYINVTK